MRTESFSKCFVKMNFTKKSDFPIDLYPVHNHFTSSLSLSTKNWKKEKNHLFLSNLVFNSNYKHTNTITHTHTHSKNIRQSSYQSRFLNKSKSSAVVSPTTAAKSSAVHHSIDDDVNNTGDDSDSIYGTGRTRYLALKERRNRLARSRSSHTMANDDDNDSTHLDEPVSPTTANPNAYLASRCDLCKYV